MLVIESSGAIGLTRGDTARISVPITNETDGSTYELNSEDKLTLTVKKSVNDAEFAFQKVLTGENAFHIKPEDTKELAFGKYVYDVQLNTIDGDVFTVIEPTTFTVNKEVTT